MIQQVLSQGMWAICAEISLILFVFSFVLILIGEALRSKSEVDHLSRLPLDEDIKPDLSRRGEGPDYVRSHS
jgi:hypothetical protein